MASAINVSILCSFDGVAHRKQDQVYDQAILSLSIFIAALSPIVVTGNALILIVIWRNRTLRTPFYMFLSGLALTDLFTGLFTQPFYVAFQLICSEGPREIADRQTFLVLARVVTGGFGSYFIYVTVLILTCMSIERWLQMSQRFLFIERRARFIFAGITLGPIPVSVFRALNILTGSYEHVLTASFSILLVCVIVISVSYFKVFRIIRCHQQQVQARETPQISVQPAINLAKYKKSVYSILYIVLLFYISYSPFIVFFGIYRSFRDHSVSEVVYVMSLASMCLSSALNPLIYLWRMNGIRNAIDLEVAL